GVRRDLQPFPTRRSSDLASPKLLGPPAAANRSRAAAMAAPRALAVAGDSASPRIVTKTSTPRSGGSFSGSSSRHSRRLHEGWLRSEEHTSELQSRGHLVC